MLGFSGWRQGNHKGCPYTTPMPRHRVRRDVVLHRYYGRVLLSEMGRGKCQSAEL